MKCEAYPIDISLALKAQIQNVYKFKWVSKHCFYLGVDIPLKCSDLYKVNFEALHNRTNILLHSWKGRFFTWLDHIQVLKIFILPKYLYLFWTILIYILTKTFTDWQMIFCGITFVSDFELLFFNRLIDYMALMHRYCWTVIGPQILFIVIEYFSKHNVVKWRTPSNVIQLIYM